MAFSRDRFFQRPLSACFPVSPRPPVMPGTGTVVRRFGHGLLWAAGMTVAACTSAPDFSPAGPAQAVSAATAPVPPPPPPAVPSDLPPQCVVQYTALLDLAGLARHYGGSSGIFLDALGDMVDQLDDCILGSQRARWSRGRAVVRASTTTVVGR